MKCRFAHLCGSRSEYRSKLLFLDDLLAFYQAFDINLFFNRCGIDCCWRGLCLFGPVLLLGHMRCGIYELCRSMQYSNQFTFEFKANLQYLMGTVGLDQYPRLV